MLRKLAGLLGLWLFLLVLALSTGWNAVWVLVYSLGLLVAGSALWANWNVAGLELRAFPMANPELWTYEVREGTRRAVLAVDDTRRYVPEEFLRDADVAVVETGWFERGTDGALLQPEGHPSRDIEASFDESLQIARRLRAGRTIFTHIEEICQRTPEEFEALERTPELLAVNGTFAWDGMRIEVGPAGPR